LYWVSKSIFKLLLTISRAAGLGGFFGFSTQEKIQKMLEIKAITAYKNNKCST